MDTDTELMESQIHEKLLGLVYHVKFFLGDGLTVYKSGSKAGKGWLVPGWKVHAL